MHEAEHLDEVNGVRRSAGDAEDEDARTHRGKDERLLENAGEHGEERRCDRCRDEYLKTRVFPSCRGRLPPCRQIR